MTEKEFQEQVLTDLAAIKERLKNSCEDNAELKKTVHGSNGMGGLVSEVGLIKQEQAVMKKDQSFFNRGVAILTALLSVVVGWLSQRP